MKRMICFVMALMISLSLALPAAASTGSPEKKPAADPTSPKTGDVITLWTGAMSVSAAGLALIAANKKKEQ